VDSRSPLSRGQRLRWNDGNAGRKGVGVALAQADSSPMMHWAEDGFDVKNGSAVDRFEVVDRDGVFLNRLDHHGVQSDRVGAIGRPRREHTLTGPVHVATWVHGEHVAAPRSSQVSKNTSSPSFKSLAASQNSGRKTTRARGAPSSPCLGAAARSVSGDSTQPTGCNRYVGSLNLWPFLCHAAMRTE
jgi:hypothetical protein